MEEFDSWPHVCELPDYERHYLKCCFEEELRELKPYVEREIHESPAAKKQKQLDSDSSAITRLSNVIQECLVVLEIAALFTGFWELLVWKYFEQKLGSNCSIFRKQLAYAFTKFILRTYDKDDFRRIVNEASYTKECEEFHKHLDILRVAIQEHINSKPESSSRLLTEEMGISLIKSIAQGNWDLKNYKFLTEMDVISMFKLCFLTFCCEEFYGFCSVMPQVPNVYLPAVKTSRVDDMLMVKSALRDCTPLEEKARCHLNKGLLSWERSNVQNFLVCELLKDTKILELKESVPTPDSIEVIGSILSDVVSCLYQVVWGRREQLETNADLIKFVFDTAWPGSFTEEVIEVVIYADYIRMHRGHDFIEVCHVLLALDRTRMVDAVRGAIRDAGLNFLYEYKAEYPIYDFYIKAKDIASYIGDGMVGVKHLVLAILWEGGKLIAGKGKEILKDFDPFSWSEFSEKVYVKNFLEETKGCSAEILSTDLEDGYCSSQDDEGNFSLYREMFDDISNDRFIILKYRERPFVL